MVVLPAPVWPTMAAVWPGSIGEGYVLEDPFDVAPGAAISSGCALAMRASISGVELLVGEPDIAELDARAAVALSGMRRRDDFRRGIQQLEDALAGCHGRLQDVVFFAQVLNGAEEALRILNECDQHAERDGGP